MIRGMKVSDRHTAEAFKLCYIKGEWAYFTTQEISEQWGDDWGDAPRSCNAGQPYYPKDNEYEVVCIAFTSDMEAPADSISVSDINACQVPWLTKKCNGFTFDIWAGTTLADFIKRSRLPEFGGEVFLPLNWFYND